MLLLVAIAIATSGCGGGSQNVVDVIRLPARDYPTFQRVLDEVRGMHHRRRPLVVLLDGVYQVDAAVQMDSEIHDVRFQALDRRFPPGLTSALHLSNWQSVNGLWTTKVPRGTNSFFVDGVRQFRSRMPMAGFYQINNFFSLATNSTFEFRNQDLKPEWAGAQLVAIQAWAESRIPILSVDQATHLATLSGRMQPYNLVDDASYWVENVPEGMANEGAWMVDAADTMIYHPPAGENPAAHDCVVPLVQQFIRITNTRNLTLDGLMFTFSDWKLPATGYANLQAAADIQGVIQMEGAENCTIINCEFRQLGVHGLWLDNGCSSNTIANNKMYDLGGGGVVIGYNDKIIEPHTETSKNIVIDNHISNIGNVYFGACGIAVLHANNTRIQGNLVHDTFYSGISVGWEWDAIPGDIHDNFVFCNDLYSIGLNRNSLLTGPLLRDLGGIYTLGDQPGTLIIGNRIHDTHSAIHGEAPGIYLDQGSNRILVKGNEIWDTDGPPYWLHMVGDVEVIP